MANFKLSSFKGNGYGEPKEPPELIDPPTLNPTPLVPSGNISPTDPPPTSQAVPNVGPLVNNTPIPLNPSQYLLPGQKPGGGWGGLQQAGGYGDPHVGTGWNNLSNFLGMPNLEYGQSLQGTGKTGLDAPAPMDLSTGRSFEAGAYDDWLWNAGGRNPGPVGNTGRPPNEIPIEPPNWGGGGGRPPKLPPPDAAPKDDNFFSKLGKGDYWGKPSNDYWTNRADDWSRGNPRRGGSTP